MRRGACSSGHMQSLALAEGGWGPPKSHQHEQEGSKSLCLREKNFSLLPRLHKGSTAGRDSSRLKCHPSITQGFKRKVPDEKEK